MARLIYWVGCFIELLLWLGLFTGSGVLLNYSYGWLIYWVGCFIELLLWLGLFTGSGVLLSYSYG